MKTKFSASNITRRSAMKQIACVTATATAPSLATAASTISQKRTGMGLVIYDCNIRRRWMRGMNPDFDLFHPLTFLKHCHSLGAGGMQANLGVMPADAVRQLRTYAEQHDLFIDAIIKPPKAQNDVSRFEAEVKTARDVGVQAARTTIIPRPAL